MSFSSLAGLIIAMYLTEGFDGTMTVNAISLMLVCYFAISKLIIVVGNMILNHAEEVK